jgi:hypothetical protein
MKDGSPLNSQNAITEIYLAANESQSLMNEFSCSTNFLDAQYKPAILEKRSSRLVKTSMRRNNTNYSKYSKNMNIFLIKFNMEFWGRIILLNVHPQHLQLPRRMELQELFLVLENSTHYFNVTHFLFQNLGT